MTSAIENTKSHRSAASTIPKLNIHRILRKLGSILSQFPEVSKQQQQKKKI